MRAVSIPTKKKRKEVGIICERNMCALLSREGSRGFAYMFTNLLRLPVRGLLCGYTPHNRNVHMTNTNLLKEIRESKDEKTLTVEGCTVLSPREPFLLKTPHTKDACPVCRTGLDIKHTDVLILSQFLRSDGCMLPRRVTGLCKRQQKRMGTMVAMAQKAGLMPNIAPANSKRDPKKRYQWKKFNKYFYESTIKA